MNEALWKPAPEGIARANMTRFLHQVQETERLRGEDYAALYDWSTREPESFWPAVWKFCDIRASRRWDRVLEHADRMPGARWFRGSRLNFAENLLRHRDDRTALVFLGEDGRRTTRSYRQLYSEVARLAHQTIATASARQEAGDQLLVFPEGSRSRDSGVPVESRSSARPEPRLESANLRGHWSCQI